MELSRISTGITALDALLDGGFIKGRSYLLTGDTGTGKTIACLQFLVSVLAREEKAIYVTVDERPADILASAASFSWDLQPHIQGKSLVILDAASGSATEKGIDPQKMVADLSSYAKSLGASVLIIDPITPLLMPTNPAIPVQVHARSLIQLIQGHLNTTNLFTSHDARGREPHAVVGTEQFLATGVLGLKATGTNGRPERTLNIKKMRYTAVNPGEYPFALVQNEGIVLMNHQNGKETHSREDLLQRDEPQFFKTFELGKKDS
jgi:circadian clock protein KaiC